MTTRRETLAAAVACALGQLAGAPTALAAPSAAGASRFTLRDLQLKGADLPFGGRVPVLVPRDAPEGARWPLVVALHGLGESADPVLAARAWPELYGLSDAAERLAAPPIVPRGKRGDLDAARAAELDRELAARPYGGLIVACPFTPNPARAGDRAGHLARYATWIREVVVAQARAQLPVIDAPRATHLAGCSMGGTVALEVITRSPGAFASVALVQSAHGAHRNVGFASALGAPAGDRAQVLVLTSEGDPFRASNLGLAAELARRGVTHTTWVPRGPHDQPWLREAGTPLMLHWLDRRPRT